MASSMKWEDARDTLRKLREEQSRESEKVVELWETVLTESSYKLGDELWLIYEQVCLAALDCNKLHLARMCFDALNTQFPDSLRVQKLHGMKFEAEEDYENALEVYQDIAEADETNTIVKKRKIAIFKAQNKIPEAIDELNKYLKLYAVDTEAWMELCDLYLQEQDYAKAGYCMEELILTNPTNHLYHQRYAEIKYTQGGQDNMEIARAYFAQAAKLNPNNMRALYGLFLSATNLASSKSKNKKDNVKYAGWAEKQIKDRYVHITNSKEQLNQIQVLDGMFNSIQISPT